MFWIANRYKKQLEAKGVRVLDVTCKGKKGTRLRVKLTVAGKDRNSATTLLSHLTNNALIEYQTDGNRVNMEFFPPQNTVAKVGRSDMRRKYEQAISRTLHSTVYVFET